MDLVEELKKFWKSLNITLDQVIVLAVVVFIFGLILLSFTFILPVLAFTAALFLIIGAVYLVYKFLGGR